LTSLTCDFVTAAQVRSIDARPRSIRPRLVRGERSFPASKAHDEVAARTAHTRRDAHVYRGAAGRERAHGDHVAAIRLAAWGGRATPEALAPSDHGRTRHPAYALGLMRPRCTVRWPQCSTSCRISTTASFPSRRDATALSVCAEAFDHLSEILRGRLACPTSLQPPIDFNRPGLLPLLLPRGPLHRQCLGELAREGLRHLGRELDVSRPRADGAKS
jgi:hypothetical protein